MEQDRERASAKERGRKVPGGKEREREKRGTERSNRAQHVTGVVNISLAFVLRRPTDVPGFIYALRYTPRSAGSWIFIANAAQLSVKKSRVLPRPLTLLLAFAVPFDTVFDVFEFLHGPLFNHATARDRRN